MAALRTDIDQAARTDAKVLITGESGAGKEIVARLGQENDGLVRAGCACYTTEEEVSRLVARVREIARSGE